MPLAATNWSRFEALLHSGLTNTQIEQEGMPAIWYKAVVCPNRMVDTNNHDINCTLCDGTGFLYDSGTAIKALTTSIGVKQMWQAFGRYDVGTAVVSVDAKNRISWWDMLEFPEALIRYSEIIKGGSSKLKYVPVEAVRVVDNTGKDYELGTDFTFDGNKLLWTATPATFLSVTYTCHPRYILLEMIHQFRRSTIRQAGIKKQDDFPLEAVAKLDFLIGEESKTT